MAAAYGNGATATVTAAAARSGSNRNAAGLQFNARSEGTARARRCRRRTPPPGAGMRPAPGAARSTRYALASTPASSGRCMINVPKIALVSYNWFAATGRFFMERPCSGTAAGPHADRTGHPAAARPLRRPAIGRPGRAGRRRQGSTPPLPPGRPRAATGQPIGGGLGLRRTRPLHTRPVSRLPHPPPLRAPPPGFRSRRRTAASRGAPCICLAGTKTRPGPRSAPRSPRGVAPRGGMPAVAPRSVRDPPHAYGEAGEAVFMTVQASGRRLACRPQRPAGR